MTATAGYLKAVRRVSRNMVVLVRISARDATSLAAIDYNFATANVNTPGGGSENATVWLPLVAEIGSISAPGDFASTDLGLCSCTIVLVESAINPAAVLLQGATVNVWLWERSLTTFDDALCVLMNARVLSWSMTGDTMTLEVRQRTEWNRDILPVEVTPDAYPHAPDESIGQSVPVVYGAMRDLPLRTPWVEYPATVDVITPAPSGTPSRGSSVVLGGRRVGSAVLVDTGRGSSGGSSTPAPVNPKARVLVASHKCKTVSDAARGLGVFLQSSQRNCYIEPAGADVFNAFTGAGILLPDNSDAYWMAVFPSDYELVANTCENPRALTTKADELNYARFDWTAGLKTCRLKLPDLPPDTGEMTDSFIFCAYQSPANTNFKTLLRPNGSLSGGIGVNLDQRTGRNILLVKYAIGPGWATPFDPAAPWSFAGLTLEVGWPTYSVPVTGTGAGEIYFVGLAFKFRPRQDIIQSERIFEHNEKRPVHRGRLGDTSWMPYVVRDTVPAVTELKGKFFANIEGYADDGTFETAGVFTGTANALIERPCDVLMHVLRAYGQESIYSIERNPGSYGCFTDARALLRSPRKQDMTCAMSIAQTADVMTVISWLAQSSVSLLMLDRFTDSWRLLPWRLDTAVDYPWKFRPQDIVEGTSLQCESTPLNRIVTGITLGYGSDAASSGLQHKVRLAWNGSNAGYKYRGIRDEYMSVTAANNKLDFTTTSVCTATLPTGDTDPGTLGLNASAAMETANSPNKFVVSWGTHIIQNWNDLLEYKDNTTLAEKVFTIPPGVYASFEDMLNAVQAGTNVTFSYSRTTRKVSAFASDLFPMTLHNQTGSMRGRRLCATMGFVAGSDYVLTGTATVAPYERAEETFAVSSLGLDISLNWELGTNGLNGTRTNCAGLLGFLGLRDDVAASGVRSWLGNSPKNLREADMLNAATRYGARRDTVEDLRAVIETDTAREVRNRVAALVGKPRLTVTFSTDIAHDIERGRVIGFTSDFDAVLPYPDPDSDGAWAGKRFVVVETEQQLGPVAFYIKIRAVSLD